MISIICDQIKASHHTLPGPGVPSLPAHVIAVTRLQLQFAVAQQYRILRLAVINLCLANITAFLNSVFVTT